MHPPITSRQWVSRVSSFLLSLSRWLFCGACSTRDAPTRTAQVCVSRFLRDTHTAARRGLRIAAAAWLRQVCPIEKRDSSFHRSSFFCTSLSLSSSCIFASFSFSSFPSDERCLTILAVYTLVYKCPPFLLLNKWLLHQPRHQRNVARAGNEKSDRKRSLLNIGYSS